MNKEEARAIARQMAINAQKGKWWIDLILYGTPFLSFQQRNGLIEYIEGHL